VAVLRVRISSETALLITAHDKPCTREQQAFPHKKWKLSPSGANQTQIQTHLGEQKHNTSIFIKLSVTSPSEDSMHRSTSRRNGWTGRTRVNRIRRNQTLLHVHQLGHRRHKPGPKGTGRGEIRLRVHVRCVKKDVMKKRLSFLTASATWCSRFLPQGVMRRVVRASPHAYL
jgi:hypothetical protein